MPQNHLLSVKLLPELISGAPSKHFCVVDELGIAFHFSEELKEYLGLVNSSKVSIFQINPEMNFMNWRKIIEEAPIKWTEEETSILKSSGDIQKVKAKYFPFRSDGNIFILYFFQLTDCQKSATEEAKSLPVVLDYNNYDDQSANPIIYFDASTKIAYKNSKAKQLYPSVFTHADDLFLESELGTLSQTVKEMKFDTEYAVRMVLKMKSGMESGYARISLSKKRSEEMKYRMEFSITKNMQLIDKPLEEAMREINRLTHVNEMRKEILIYDNLQDFSFEQIVTQSPRYKAVLRQAAIVADTSSTVLITGETGTGKELLCNAIYSLSDRSDEVIIKVNCATIPENLIESLLFGHEKGSFTGAHERRLGKLEQADGGTIFLDEIGEMPLHLQAKLLRFLQEGEIERIGKAEAIKVDVRVIAATNRNLEKLVKENKFRSDLFYRLNVFPIYNIPLRERKEDISILAKHFVQKANKKTGRDVKIILEKDLKLLERHSFPGNVRELENIIERSVIESEGETLKLSPIQSGASDDENRTISGFFELDEMIRMHIIEALKLCGGKITGSNSASELLKVNGKTLVSKIKKLGINVRNIETNE